MLITQFSRVAGSTFLAVKEILATTDSADATVIAMVLPFLQIIIVEFAHIAEIVPHTNSTV